MHYEGTFIARQDLSATQAANLLEELAAIAEKNGGTVNKKEYWGVRNLAYKIKKNRKAHYLYLEFTAPSAGLTEFHRLAGLHEDVMRFLFVRVNAFEDGATVMLTNKQREENAPASPMAGRDEGYRPRTRRAAPDESAA
jgi:small subunit ribosomal protein S6